MRIIPRVHPKRGAGLAAAFAVTAGLVVSGCGQIHPGAAALVGEQRIATGELSQAVDATARAAEQHNLRVKDRAALVRSELSRLISDSILHVTAKRADVTVTKSAVDRQIARAGGTKRLELQALRRAAVPPGDVRQYVRNQLIRQKLAQSLSPGGDVRSQSTALVKHLRGVASDVGVTVSPRYGRFSGKQFAVVPEKSELSTPDSDSQGNPGLMPQQGGRR